MNRLFGAAALLATLALLPAAHAVTRDAVILRAHAFAYHPWHCAAANLTGSCGGGYQSAYVVGDFMGLPYDWGGYMSLFTFDQRIADGYGAGSYPSDGELDCTVGLDCSGFVSQAWTASHNSTSSIPDISTVISQANMLPGDVFNQAGYHVFLYERTLNNGDPIFYEAAGYNVHVNATGGWSYGNGYTPRRYQGITGTGVSNPVGTMDNPIVISSFPYTDSSRDTSQAVSDVLDGCDEDASKSEAGPEYIYQVTFTQPGQLAATVSDDADVDIDIHLYTSFNTNDCVARHDSTIQVAVDCGTYYLVADTFRSTDGAEDPGEYTLSVSFTPSGGNCGSGPSAYDFAGELGDPCGYPGHEDLPFCNDNLGADTCIYTTSPPSSFCSRPCSTAGDCSAFAGGCCAPIGNGETYCLPAALCDGDDDTGDGGAAKDGGTQPGDPSSDGAVAYDDDGDSLDGDGSDGGCNVADRGGHSLLATVLTALALLALARRRPLRRE